MNNFSNISKTQRSALFGLAPVSLVLGIGIYFTVSTLDLLGWWIVGWLLGIVLMILDDVWLHSLYSDLRNDSSQMSEATSSIQVPTEVAQSGASQSAPSIPQLITRSPLFMAVLPVLIFFMMTSSGSILGIGMVLAIAWTLFLEMMKLVGNPVEFYQRFYHPTKQLPLKELRYFVQGVGAFVLVISLLSWWWL